jgi:hypothetical protein
MVKICKHVFVCALAIIPSLFVLRLKRVLNMFIVLGGFAASGKSTIAKHLQDARQTCTSGA